MTQMNDPRPSGLQVVVAGGGLGGLALAAGLVQQGVCVTVVEPDTDLAATGGYHITLQSPVQRALARLLPPRAFEQLLASAADGRHRDPDALWDPRSRLVGRVALKSDDPGIDIDRITLREILAGAAAPTLLLGRRVERFERHDGGVITYLDDGTELRSDLLVGADGVHSTVARQLAGRRTSRPAGIVGVSGRTPVARLDPHDREQLGVRSSLGVGPGATALYLGYLDPVGHAVLDQPNARRSVTGEPTFIWGAMFGESPRTRHLTGDPAEIRDATLRLFRERGWSGRLLEVVARTTTHTVGAFRFHAGPCAERDQAPWAASRVTALGDAVHATPPTAGMGAGVAILDAEALMDQVGLVVDGTKTLPVGVRDFEAGMRERGAEVVRRSMVTVDQILRTGTNSGAAATRVALPAMAAASWVRSRGGRSSENVSAANGRPAARRSRRGSTGRR